MPPKNKLIDHDDDGTADAAQAAAMSEAQAADYTVEFGGNTYTIAFDTLTSIDYLEAAQDGHDTGMVRALLGRVQWAQFKTRHTQRPEMQEFMSELAKAVGVPNS